MPGTSLRSSLADSTSIQSIFRARNFHTKHRKTTFQSNFFCFILGKTCYSTSNSKWLSLKKHLNRKYCFVQSWQSLSHRSTAKILFMLPNSTICLFDFIPSVVPRGFIAAETSLLKIVSPSSLSLCERGTPISVGWSRMSLRSTSISCFEIMELEARFSADTSSRRSTTSLETAIQTALMDGRCCA